MKIYKIPKWDLTVSLLWPGSSDWLRKITLHGNLNCLGLSRNKNNHKYPSVTTSICLCTVKFKRFFFRRILNWSTSCVCLVYFWSSPNHWNVIFILHHNLHVCQCCHGIGELQSRLFPHFLRSYSTATWVSHNLPKFSRWICHHRENFNLKQYSALISLDIKSTLFYVLNYKFAWELLHVQTNFRKLHTILYVLRLNFRRFFADVCTNDSIFTLVKLCYVN